MSAARERRDLLRFHALLKFVKPEKESRPCGTGERAPTGSRLVIERTAGWRSAARFYGPVSIGNVCPMSWGRLFAGCTSSIHQYGARSGSLYGIWRLGSFDAVHFATADPFLTELTVRHLRRELAEAAAELGFPTTVPS